MSKRLVSQLAFLASLMLMYFAAGKLGLRLAFVNASATAVWPPTGIALAAFVMLGYRIWPAILLGAFLVNVTTSGVVATSIAIAVGNTLEGVVGGYLVNRFAHGRHVFEQARDIFTYVVLACILSTAVSATIGVTSLAVSGLAAWANYGPIWLTWWLGDAVGAILVTPVLMLWAMSPRVRWDRGRGVEAILLCLSALLVAVIVFGGLFRFGIQHYPLEFLMLPIIVWAAFRFGQRGAATLALGLSGIAIGGTLAGFGPFARVSPGEALLLLQVFMGVVALTGLGMAAVVAERQHVREVAERAAERTRRLQQVTASLSEALTAEDVATVIVGAGSAAFQADAGAVFRLNDDAQLFELIEYTGYPAEAEPRHRRSSVTRPGPLRDAVLTRELVIVESAAELLARWPHLQAAQAQSGDMATVAVPLLSDQRVLGVFYLAFRTERRFNDDDRAFLTTLGRQCALALVRADLYNQERRARGEAEAAKQLREQFLSVAAHELKTPLTTLLGQAQFFQRRAERDGQLNARDQQTLRVINDQVRRLNRMVLALLDVSRIERGQLSIERAALDICALTRRIVDEIQLTITDRRIEIQGSAAPIIVAGDEVRLEQVLQNLLQNAVKYSDPPQPITVTMTRQADEVRIEVRDQGMGIPADALPGLFQRFYRAANAEAQHISGMGIGLYVVKEIMALHDGGVSVESTEGSGSTFTVWLPVDAHGADREQGSVAHQPSDAAKA